MNVWMCVEILVHCRGVSYEGRATVPVQVLDFCVCVGGSAVVKACLGVEVGGVAVGDRDVVLVGRGSGEGLNGVDALVLCVYV